MNMILAQDALIAKIKEVSLITVTDNILELPTRFPFIAVDPVSSELTKHNGGTVDPQRHFFDIYAVQSLTNMDNNLKKTRTSVAGTLSTVLSLPRIYASSDIHYGEDVIGSTRVSFAKVTVSFPI